MSTFPVRFEVADKVAIVTLDRPESRNAMNRPLVEGVLNAFHRAESDPEVRVIILTGADPVFCAGADLKELAAAGVQETEARVDLSADLYSAAQALSKPVIGAINGHALAGGFGLAMSCDLLIASDHAEFGLPESQRGLVAALVMVSLSRLVSPRHAMDLLLTGRRVSAQEALALGLVNEICPKDGVLRRARELADLLASYDPTALGITKNLFYRVADSSVAGGLEQSRLANLLFRSLDTAKSGARSFTGAARPSRSSERERFIRETSGPTQSGGWK